MDNDLISRSALMEEIREYVLDEDEIMNDLDREYNKGLLRAIKCVKCAPVVDAVPVRHGKWKLKAHDKRVNYLWTVTAYCTECCDEEKEIWSGYFPGVPDCLARDVALQEAEQAKMSNYCPNCGAKMDGKDGDNGV